jgi:hypothetical protein
MNKLDTMTTPDPGAIPKTPIIWPASRHVSNQVQQTKGSAKPQATFVLPTTQPNTSAVPPRTTPQHVSGIRIVSQKAVNGQKTIVVQFRHPAGDPYFAGAHIYLRRAGSTQPVLVAGGFASPLRFTVPVHNAPHVLHVSSWGNWGETDILSSPSRPVRLI